MTLYQLWGLMLKTGESLDSEVNIYVSGDTDNDLLFDSEIQLKVFNEGSKKSFVLIPKSKDRADTYRSRNEVAGEKKTHHSPPPARGAD